jgi:hypothetical protein
MALQHHFVVIVEDGKIYLDTEATDRELKGWSIWNTDINEWQETSDHAIENEKAQELLWDKLHKENA